MKPLGLLLIAIVGVFLYFLFGLYDVRADSPHWKVTFVLLEGIRDRSIDYHSRGIEMPDLNSEDLFAAGFPHFNGMCRMCHGAPGAERAEFAGGLYPLPPSLASGDIQKEMGAEELFWIIKHGLKMTGMPSFGSTHKDEEICSILAVLKKLPAMSPEDYQQAIKQYSGQNITGQPMLE